MDFIIRLLLLKFKGKVYDSILIVVDRYTKLACYILITKDIIALELAKLFILFVIKDFSIPRGITLDRGSVFISYF